MVKRFRIKEGVLRFEDFVTEFNDYLRVPAEVCEIDFNNLLHISKPLRLDHTQIKSIDFGKLITVTNVYLPDNIEVTENLYWAEAIIGKGLKVNSPRLEKLGVYSHKPFIYLSGTVGGFLEKRTRQRDELIALGYGVYSPGNHMTFGDPIADNNPKLVYDVDIKAMEKADIIVFDLSNLSPGTCAELGYAIAAKWYKTKRLYALNLNTKNFFIKGLAAYLRPLQENWEELK